MQSQEAIAAQIVQLSTKEKLLEKILLAMQAKKEFELAIVGENREFSDKVYMLERFFELLNLKDHAWHCNPNNRCPSIQLPLALKRYRDYCHYWQFTLYKMHNSGYFPHRITGEPKGLICNDFPIRHDYPYEYMDTDDNRLYLQNLLDANRFGLAHNASEIQMLDERLASYEGQLSGLDAPKALIFTRRCSLSSSFSMQEISTCKIKP